MKYHIHTLGCKFNQYESAKIDSLLSEEGYTRVKAENADIVIVNSCAVTTEAVRKSFQITRHFSRLCSKPKVIFTGCAVHSESDIPSVDLVIGNGEKLKIVDFIEKKGVFVDRTYDLKDNLDYSVNKIPDKTRAFLSVENGCTWKCAYCAIPNFRGRTIRSKPIEVAVDEARRMISQGIKEIVITGINVALYKDGEKDLGNLLEELLNLKGNFRIRIGSIDPKSLMKIVHVFKRDKMCHHVHLSVQSGSDVILKRMRRPYTANDILEVTKNLKEIDEFFSFSVDVIAGFPSEGAKEFEETCELLKKIGVSRIHAFPFSARENTEAFYMKEKVDGKTKKTRVKVLRKLGEEMAKRFRERMKSARSCVLVEKVEDGWAEGFDEYYIRRSFEYNGEVGNFVEFTEKVANRESFS